MENIAPVQNTNNIRYADFVRVTTPSATYRFASTPSALTVPAVDAQPFENFLRGGTWHHYTTNYKKVV